MSTSFYTRMIGSTALGSAALLAATSAHANPEGGVVTGGEGTITNSGSTVTVNQSSERMIVDWRSFNISPNELTQFFQPGSSSIALNRVNDINPSSILGSLTANGHVIIVNPNGVVFGAGAKVNVGSLTATTSDINNDRFMNDSRLVFDKAGNANAKIINQGEITAREAGLVGLVAPQVENSGVITARLGRATLASGDGFTLDMAGDGIISVKASDELTNQLVRNSGSINADGGMIKLTAAAARNQVNALIDNSGNLHATSVSQKNGKIVISAEGSNAVAGNVAADKGTKSGNTTVTLTGTVDASGKGAGETGGSISVLADQIAVLDGATIDTSGASGGGTIKIGGDYHGEGDTPTARKVIVTGGASITSDAITSGNGGNVTVWADDATSFAGTISARGGEQGGDGGFAEVSGKNWLGFNGLVDLRAPNGNVGNLLLDPGDITISSAADTSGFDNVNGFWENITGSATNINVVTLENQLGLSDVNIYTYDGSITFNNSVTWSSNSSLYMYAGEAINFNADVKNTGNGMAIINAVSDGIGGINIGAGVTLQSGTQGYISLITGDNSGRGRIQLDGVLKIGSGGLELYSRGINDDGETSLADITLDDSNIIALNSSFNSFNIGGFSNITINKDITANHVTLSSHIDDNDVGQSLTGHVTLGNGRKITTDDLNITGILADTGSFKINSGSLTITGLSDWSTGNYHDLTFDSSRFDLSPTNTGITLQGFKDLDIQQAITSSGDLIFNASKTTLNNNISAYSVSLGATTLGANISITGTTDVTFNSTVDGAYNLTTNSGTGRTTFSGLVGNTTALNNLSITGNELTLSNNIKGTGNLTIKPYTAGTAININNGTSGLDISTTQLGRIQNGWSSINFGDSTTGAINIIGSNTWNDNLALTTGSGAINITGAQTFGSNTLTATSTSGDITLTQDMLSLASGSSLNTSGGVIIRPQTANYGMSIGTNVANTLNISNTQLGYLTSGTYGTLYLGGASVATATAGTMTIDTSNTFAKKVAFNNASGYDITLQNTDFTSSYTGSGNAVAINAGQDLNLSRAITTSATTGTSNLFLSAYRHIGTTGGISGSGALINMIFNSDRDGNSDGGVYFNAGSYLSYGGNIIIGGGTGTITAGNGYAYGSAGNNDGVVLWAHPILNANGGNIVINGVGSGTGTGIELWGAQILTAGNGTIDLYGRISNDYTSGIWSYNYSGNSTIAAAAGAITLDGRSTGAYGTGMELYYTDVYTTSGAININAKGGSSAGVGYYYNNGAGGAPTFGNGSTSGTITINADSFVAYNASPNIAFQTSGDIVIKPLTAGRGMSIGADVSNTLNIADWEMGYFNYGGNLYLGGTSSATATAGTMTIDSSNAFTKAVTFANASGYDMTLQNTDLTTTSNFTFDSGNNLNINRSISKTGASASNFLFKAKNDIVLASSMSISSSTGVMNTTLQSDSDADGTNGGAILLNYSTSISSNGGNIVLGGGTDVSTGYAQGNATNKTGVTNNGTIDSGSGSGTITVRGRGYMNSTTSANAGVSNGGTIQTAGTGAITLVGLGGNTSSGGTNWGVATGTIQSTGTNGGAITITGYSGNTSAGTDNYAVSSSGSIASKDGNIVINGNTGILGQAVANPTGNRGYGFNLFSSGTITSSGNANITINGVGTGSGTSATGAFIIGTIESTATNGGGITINGYSGVNGNGSNAGVNIINSGKVISKDGNIVVNGNTGIGGQTVASNGASSQGVNLSGGGSIQSTGNATIGVTGIGGGATDTNNGIFVSGATSKITSATGAISLTGTGSTTANGTGNNGISISSGSVESTGTATISLTGTAGAAGTLGYGINTSSGTIGGTNAAGMISLITDSWSLGSGTNIQTSGDILARTRTSGYGMSVGANVANTLNLDNTSLGYFNWGNTLYLGGTSVGTATAGAITIDTNNNFAKKVAFNNASGYDITLQNTNLTSSYTGSGNAIEINSGRDLNINRGIVAGAAAGSGASNMFLSAYRAIISSSNGALSVTNTGTVSNVTNTANLTMNSDRDGNLDGYINLGSGTFATNGGNITLGGGSGSITAGSGYAWGNGTRAQGIYNTANLDARGSSTTGGNIIMNGQGYTGGVNTTDAHGIYFNNIVQTNNSGSITMNGTGGGSGTGNGIGVYMETGTLRAVDGNINLTGTATLGSAGVSYYLNTIETTGIGNINITGTGTGSWGNSGISSANVSTVRSTGGGSINFVASNSTGWGWDIWFQNTTIGNAGTANVTFTANNLNDQPNSVTASNNITIKPRTAGYGVTIGTNVGGTLNVSNAFLGTLNYDNTLYLGGTSVGTATAGTMTIDTSTTFSKKVAFNNASGYDITLQNTNLTSSYTGSGNAIEINSGRDLAMNMSLLDSATSGTSNIFLSAYRNISSGSGKGISGSGTLINMTLNADRNGNSDGYIYTNAGSFLSNGGNITFGGGSGSITAGSGYAYGTGSTGGIDLSQHTTLNANGGNIVLNGSSTGSGMGVSLSGSQLTTTGNGTIDIYGRSNSGWGVRSNNYAGDPTISAAAGAINFDGRITGTSGLGVELYNANVYTTSGAINITGKGGNSSWDYGYSFNPNAGTAPTIGNGSTSGTITLTTDTIDIGAGTGLTFQTTGDIVIKPLTANSGMSVGTSVASTLNVSNILLGLLNYGGTLNLGDTNTGNMTVNTSNSFGKAVAFTVGNGYTNSITGALTGTGTTGAFSFYGPTTLSNNITTAGGNIAFNNAVTLGANSALDAGTGTLSFASTVNGGYDLTGTAGTMSFGGAMGGSTRLGAVSLTSTSALTLPAITALSIFARTTGATSDLTLGGNLNANAATTTPVTLVAKRNFLDSGNYSINPGTGRWLIYSTNPDNTNPGNALTEAFHRYSCTYSGSCPTLGSGNGMLYSYTPYLLYTPDAGVHVTYGDAVNFASQTSTISGYRTGDSVLDTKTGAVSYTSDYSAGSNAGLYNVTSDVSALASSLGYGFTGATTTNALTADKRNVTASFTAALDKTYGDANPTVDYNNFTFGNMVGGDNKNLFSSISTNFGGAGTNSNVGSYTVTSTIGSTTNYNVTSTPTTTLTIDKRDLTIVTDSKTKTYGDANPSYTGSVTGLTAFDSGLVSYVYAPNGYSGNAGSYTIAANATDASSRLGNYTIHSTLGTLTVDKRDVTASYLAPLEKTYGDANPTVNYTNFSFSNMVSGDSTSVFSSISTNFGVVDANTGIGSYAVSSSIGSTGNYNVTNTPSSTLTIAKRELTVTTNNKQKLFGLADPVFTGSVTGLTSYDSSRVSYAYAPVTYSGDVGNYTIAASATDNSGRLANYNVTNNYGLFAVFAGSDPITEPTIPTFNDIARGGNFILPVLVNATNNGTPDIVANYGVLRNAPNSGYSLYKTPQLNMQYDFISERLKSASSQTVDPESSTQSVIFPPILAPSVSNSLQMDVPDVSHHFSRVWQTHSPQTMRLPSLVTDVQNLQEIQTDLNIHENSELELPSFNLSSLSGSDYARYTTSAGSY